MRGPGKPRVRAGGAAAMLLLWARIAAFSLGVPATPLEAGDPCEKRRVVVPYGDRTDDGRRCGGLEIHGPGNCHSEMRIEDLYKAIHAGFLGPGHAVASREAAAARLEEEWSHLGPTPPDEPLIERPVADAPFVRLHLRPYRDRGGSLDSLLDAFLRSAAAPADTVCFRRVWESCLSALRTVDEPHFSTAAVDSFGAFVRARGFPAVHHSAPYVASAHPAYRVLTCPEAFRIARLFPETEMRGK